MTKLRAAECEGRAQGILEKRIKLQCKGTEMKEKVREKLAKLRMLMDAVCGIYARVARRLGLHRTFVSRVARGERHSPPVERALVDEYEKVQKQ